MAVGDIKQFGYWKAANSNQDNYYYGTTNYLTRSIDYSYYNSLKIVDQNYVQNCKTAILDGSFNYKFNEAGKFLVAQTSFDGLSEYAGKYPDGSVKLEWKEYAPNFNQATAFDIDYIENNEAGQLMLADLVMNFEAQKVFPILDSFRLSKYASKAEAANVISEDLANAKAIVASLRTAIDKIEEAEADPTNCVCFIAPSVLNAISDMDTTASRAVLNELGAYVKIPQRRLYTSGEFVAKKGFQPKASDSKLMNFIIVDKTKLIQANARLFTKVFSPEENQISDGYRVPYHRYEIADILESGKSAIVASVSTVDATV